MKHKIILFAMLLLAISPQFSYSQDTLWTRRYDIPGSIKNAIFSPDDSKILVTGTETFFEVNPENGEMIRELPEYKTGIIALNPNTNIGINYLCQLVDLNTYQVVKDIIDTNKYRIYSNDGINLNFTFNKDLNKIAFVNYTYPIGNGNYHQNNVIIDLETGKENIIEKELGDNEGSAAISMSSDGKYLATLTYYFGQNQDPLDDYIMLSLYDLETNKKIKKITFPMDYANIWSMKFSPDGSMLALENGYVNIYTTPNLEFKDKFQFTPTLTQIYGYEFTKDSEKLVLVNHQIIQTIVINSNILVSENLYSNILGEFIRYANKTDNILISNTADWDETISLFKSRITGLSINKNEMKLVPNPVTGELILQLSSLQVDNCKILILDINGRSLFNQEYKFIKDDLSINVSNYLNGIYFINIESNNKIIQTLKFIKE